MNYQSGRMGVAEGIGLAYAITFPLVFLSTPANLAEAAGSLSWATPLSGGLGAGILLWIQQALLKRFPGDLFSLSEQLLGTLGAYAVSLFYLFSMYATACLWTRQFAENTLLTALPSANFTIIVLFYGLSVLLLVYLGIEASSRASYLILPFAIGGLLLVLAGLTPVIKPLYLFPLLGNGLPSVVSPTLFLIGAHTPLALLVILAPAFQNTQTIRATIFFGVGGASVIRALANAVYIASFSAAIGLEKTLPFYEMARLLYINRYIQRLESLFILLWVMIGVLGIATCLYGTLYIIVRLFKLPTPKPVLLPLSLIMINIASLPPDAGIVSSLERTLFGSILAPGFVITTLVLLIAGLKRSGGKRCD
ncbi:MAG: spore germination protein [Anaerosporomusa subterranea]|jgi:spore germination protein (amino acid permease)|nr:spore germination protein [Anaerosporomusa subterranea]